MKVVDFKIDLKWRILGLLLLLSFLYAFWQHFTSDILPIHECRKSDSLTQAIQYMRGAKFLEPQTNWISPSGNRNAAAEFPIVYYILGQIWKITGYQLWISKLLSLSILIVGVSSLHRLLFWIFESKNKALIFAGVMFSAPVLIYYADTVLPNIYAFSFLLLAISACFSFVKNQHWLSYMAFTLFLSLAILIKVTSLIAVLAFVGAYVLQVFISNNWKAVLRERRTYLIALSGLLALGAAYFWYTYAIRYNEKYESTIFSTTIRPIWEVDAAEQWRIIQLVCVEHLKEMYHQIILIPLVILSFWALFKRNLPIYLRCLIVISYLGLAAYFILWFWVFDVHDYYFIEILFFPYVLIGLYMKYSDQFITNARWRKRISIAGLSLIFLNTVSYTQVAAGNQNIIVKNTPLTSSFIRGNWGWFYFNQDETLGQIQAQREDLKYLIGSNDTVFCFSDPYPNVHLTAIDRIGYSNYSLFRDQPFIPQIQELIQKGASKLLILQQDTAHVDIKPFLKHLLYKQKHVQLYDLKPFRK
jgi:hypothetical protein